MSLNAAKPGASRALTHPGETAEIAVKESVKAEFSRGLLTEAVRRRI
jgi:hypothetical protein